MRHLDGRRAPPQVAPLNGDTIRTKPMESETSDDAGCDDAILDKPDDTVAPFQNHVKQLRWTH